MTASRSLALVAISAGVLLACGDSGSTTAGSGGSTSTDTSTSTSTTGGTGGLGGAAATSGSGGTMLNPGTLVDDGLVVRYLIDEADVGQTPTELVDSAPAPLAVPIVYAPELVFAADAQGRRGLKFSSTNSSGRASVALDGTKLQQEIHASGSVTIEVVADLTDIDNPAPFVLFGQYYWGPRLTMTAWTETLLSISMNDSSAWADFFVDVPATGRTVYHAVVDTSAPGETDRLRIYVNGARLTPIDVEPAAQNTLIDLSIGNQFVIGNDNNNTLSPEGTFYYVAVYSTPLTDDQILQNTGLLLFDDDAPAL